ncbi:MAG TPA: DinB family protein [Longimicrobiales bacterium]|nr:DinB family protein [Longimicrobiales bacterium]
MSIFTNPASSSREDAAAYTAALLDLLGTQRPLDVLARTPAALEKLIAGIDSKRLATPEAPGKWSVRHVLAHLADAEIVGAWRFRMILAHDRPPIQGYDQDAWANSLWYDEAEPQQSLATFAALRGWNVRLLERASPDQLRRVGMHAERGEESVEHLIKMYAGHDLLHRNQVQRILDVV